MQDQRLVSNNYSQPVSLTVCIHQGLFLSPLVFIIVMEALSHKFQVSCANVDKVYVLEKFPCVVCLAVVLSKLSLMHKL